MLLLAAACGTQTAPATAAPSKQPGEGPCPQAAPAPGATPCVTNGTVQNQQDNQSFNDRKPLTAAAMAEAAPITRRISQSLERLSPAERLQVSAVRSALLESGMYQTDLVVFGGAPTTNVAFGGYIVLNTRSPACAWGTVSVKAVDVESGGITREGACLPSAGGGRPLTFSSVEPGAPARHLDRAHDTQPSEARSRAQIMQFCIVTSR